MDMHETLVAHPRVTDNDRDEIRVTLHGVTLRSWEYDTEAVRRLKMKLAREFVEGWLARDAAQVSA